MADLLKQTLREASYEGLSFPVTEMSLQQGHDSVEHTAYLRPGADIEPTGLQPLRGKLTAVFINDVPWARTLYPDTYEDLRNLFRSTPIGTLIHPTDGSLTVHIKAWTPRFTAEVRNGCYLEFDWVAHNGSSSDLSLFADTPTNDAPTQAVSQAYTADGVAATDGATTYTPLGDTYVAQLAYLESATRSYAEITSVLNSLVALCTANLALTELSTLSFHETRQSLETLRATTYALRERYLGTVTQPRTYTVPTQMSLSRISVAIYGDVTRTQLLSAANRIPDPLFVPAGTVLIAPDLG